MAKPSPLDLFIDEIHQRPEFPALVEKLSNARPVLPMHDGTNVERWKTMSGMIQGFDLCLSVFKVKLEKDHD